MRALPQVCGPSGSAVRQELKLKRQGPRGRRAPARPRSTGMILCESCVCCGAPGCRRGTASKVTEALGLLGVSDVGDLF